MGNRAVITFTASKSAPCIYLHWNGGRASVEAFLRAARHFGLNKPVSSTKGISYDTQAKALDAIAEMIRADFGMSSVYRETYGSADTDNWDNGVYVIDNTLNVVGRLFMRHAEEIDFDKTQAIYSEIVNNRQTREI